VSVQTNIISPISCIKRLGGVGIKVINIIFIPIPLRFLIEMMEQVLFVCIDTSI
jgi:hypothetical protein